MENYMTQRTTETQPAHIGWDLWQATFAWKGRYTQEMVELGYTWYGEARGNLMQHITAEGISQSELVSKTGLSKQAIQQLLDDLTADDVIERIQDPVDSRRRLVVLTKNGLKAFRAANKVKLNIESEYQQLLGVSAFKNLRGALIKIVKHEGNNNTLPR